MSLEKLEGRISKELGQLEAEGRLKGKEKVITGISEPKDGFGPRYYLKGEGEKLFLRMNSNSYLGLSLKDDTAKAEEEAAREFGTGPGAVRFISGTFAPHKELERRLASFHKREASIIYSSAYAAVMGTLPRLITEDTVVISDALNHNCIINAIRLARSPLKKVYPHLDMDGLEKSLGESRGKARRAVIVTDGIFSMRGDHAPLDRIADICSRHDSDFEEGVISVADDSHGVGAFGKSGRGTEEYTGGRADILIATLGKALGVNGGYAVSSRKVIDYLRETSPFYIYSNPVTPSEAAAAIRSLHILDSAEGLKLLERLRSLTCRLKKGLGEIGLETIHGNKLWGSHPIVPLMIRDTEKTARLVNYLFDKGILATGLNFPIVPKGDEEIRFQVSADHREKDIDLLLDTLKDFTL
ncbi:MAG: aminotransferase class I/II-fold pyridoxal phosphate-dependent enzyme [bacterium]|nr:aminotransferase class I/II-fold pyridoxal phosphate-dependent enzyme [bacterium]